MPKPKGPGEAEEFYRGMCEIFQDHGSESARAENKIEQVKKFCETLCGIFQDHGLEPVGSETILEERTESPEQDKFPDEQESFVTFGRQGTDEEESSFSFGRKKSTKSSDTQEMKTTPSWANSKRKGCHFVPKPKLREQRKTGRFPQNVQKQEKQILNNLTEEERDEKMKKTIEFHREIQRRMQSARLPEEGTKVTNQRVVRGKAPKILKGGKHAMRNFSQAVPPTTTQKNPSIGKFSAQEIETITIPPTHKTSGSRPLAAQRKRRVIGGVRNVNTNPPPDRVLFSPSDQKPQFICVKRLPQ